LGFLVALKPLGPHDGMARADVKHSFHFGVLCQLS
jgi:hypothetical protein